MISISFIGATPRDVSLAPSALKIQMNFSIVEYEVCKQAQSLASLTSTLSTLAFLASKLFYIMESRFICPYDQ